MTAETTIRLAREDDAAGVNEVYNPFIRDSAATFELEEYAEADRRAWLARHRGDARYPVFVAERAGKISGFANAAPFDPREGYNSSVKTSVFIRPDRHGEGLGGRLYEALFAALAMTDLHRAYALIVAPNPASEALHKAFGFRHATTLSEVGRKFDRYHDVMWFEKRL